MPHVGMAFHFHRLKEAECALSLRSVEIVDKSQKPECTRRNSRYRWHLLTLGFPASNLVLERTKG
jgi:hypothetical protein